MIEWGLELELVLEISFTFMDCIKMVSQLEVLLIVHRVFQKKNAEKHIS
jgi:hypothetical protein